MDLNNKDVKYFVGKAAEIPLLKKLAEELPIEIVTPYDKEELDFLCDIVLATAYGEEEDFTLFLNRCGDELKTKLKEAVIPTSSEVEISEDSYLETLFIEYNSDYAKRIAEVKFWRGDYIV